MFWNYLKIALRSIRKNYAFSVINILGLSIGLAGFILILLYLNYEKSYDRWHPHLEHVYRVGMENAEGIAADGATQAPLAAFLKENMKDIQSATRISPALDYEILTEANGKKIYQTGLTEVDSLFFSVFPYKIVRGAAATVLQQPDAIVISTTIASRFFGNADPVGEQLKIFGGAVTGVITGVFEPVSTPTHLPSEIFYRSPWEEENNNWSNFSYSTYISTVAPINQKSFDEQITAVYAKQQLNLSDEQYNSYITAANSNRFFT